MTVLHQSIEQFRQTSERMMNVSKQQFKRFEISAEEIPFQTMRFALNSECFY